MKQEEEEMCEIVNCSTKLQRCGEVDAEKPQSPTNVFLCCEAAASGGEEVMHGAPSQIRPFFFIRHFFLQNPHFWLPMSRQI